MLPPVGRRSSCTLKGEHPDAEGRALVADMPLMLCGSVSFTHTHTGRNTLACDPGGERFKFQVGRVGAKGRGEVSSYSVVLREVPPSAPQRLRDRNSHTTHAATWNHDTDCTLSHKDTDAKHTCKHSTAQIKVRKNILQPYYTVLGTDTCRALIVPNSCGFLGTKHLEKLSKSKFIGRETLFRNKHILWRNVNKCIEQSNCWDVKKKVHVHRHLVASKPQ